MAILHDSTLLSLHYTVLGQVATVSIIGISWGETEMVKLAATKTVPRATIELTVTAVSSAAALFHHQPLRYSCH